MPVIIEYKVSRLRGPEDRLEEQLNVEGTSRWTLAALLHEPAPGNPGAGEYLAIFYRQQ